MKNHELAIQDYTEAINIQDDNAMYYNNRGLAFMQTVKCYEKAKTRNMDRKRRGIELDS